MNIRQMEYFLAAAEEGTISAAAEKLNIAQPSLSIQIRGLEEELGVRLMNRGGRRITLTMAGQLLYRRALSIIDLTDTTVRELRAFANGLQGIVSLGTISSCGAILLAERLPRFHAAYPQVSFELSEGNTFELLEKIHRNEIELAMVRTPFREEGLDCHYIEEEPLVASGRAEFFAEVPLGSLGLENLASLPLIYYRRYEHMLNSLFQQYSLHPKIVCKTDDARTCLMWARAGLGVALTPRSMVPMMDNGSLHWRSIDNAAMHTRVAIVRQSGQTYSTAASCFWDFITESESDNR